MSVGVGERPLNSEDELAVLAAISDEVLKGNPGLLQVRDVLLKGGVILIETEGEAARDLVRDITRRMERPGPSTGPTLRYHVRNEEDIPPVKFHLVKVDLMAFTWEQSLRQMGQMNPGFNTAAVRVVSSNPVNTPMGRSKNSRRLVLELGAENDELIAARRHVLFGLPRRVVFQEIRATRAARLRRADETVRESPSDQAPKEALNKEAEQVAEEMEAEDTSTLEGGTPKE